MHCENQRPQNLSPLIDSEGQGSGVKPGEQPRRANDTQRQITRTSARGLYLAAKRSRNRRFHALYDRIFRPDILWRAWEEVGRNGGSAGIDGITIEDVTKTWSLSVLATVQQTL